MRGILRQLGATLLTCWAGPILAQPAGDPGEASPRPASLEITYTGEINTLASGGIRRGTRYLDNLDVVATADLERVAGWKGASAFAYVLYNNGKSFSPLVGDAFVTTNIETGVSALRLYEAWIEQKLGKRASLRVGLYDLNSEFDVLDTAGLFISSAHGIGPDISQSGQNGPSIFPVTSLAARVSLDLNAKTTLRAAVLDGVPGDPARPKRTAIELGKGDGALLIGEVERRTNRGKLIAGYWRYTAPFDRFDGGRDRRNQGAYLRGETQLVREAGYPEQGLTGFFRFGLADGRINGFGKFASAGLAYQGPMAGRDQDQLGLAVASAFSSRDFRRLTGAQRHETSIELTYRMPVTHWLTVQPDVQYIINPGLIAGVRNALVFGLRAELGWTVF